jgi:two-component system chemotaxis response regulator CheB
VSPSLIRVLVVDDLQDLEGVTRLLRAHPRFELVAVVPRGVGACDAVIAHRPDLVLMRGCSSQTTPAIVREVMSRLPTPILVMTDGHSDGDGVAGLEALRAGAMDLRPLPRGFPLPPSEERELVEHLTLLASTPAVYRPTARTRRRSFAPSPASQELRTQPVVGIVASTGGPPVLADLLGALDPSFPAPILLVQHLGAGFVGQFRTWLGEQTPLRVEIAREGAELEPGTVVLAPADHHLAVTPSCTLRLDDGPPEEGHRPSGNVLLRSLAAACGRQSIGLLLSGMGTDGAAGLLAVRSAGGATLVQDQTTSVVFGMPGHALAIGAASEAVPRGELAQRVRDLVVGAAATRSSPGGGGR